MKIKNTYPTAPKHTLQRRKLLNIVRWPFWIAGYGCPVLNLIVGGKAWSAVVVIALIMAWKLVLCPDLVEYNRISQFIKLIACSCLLLGAIDLFLASGWAMKVIPLVSFGGLVGSGLMFFTDIQRQKQNMLPMLLLIFFCLVASIVGVSVLGKNSGWELIVMGSVALAQLVAIICTLGGEFLRELRRRFHIK
jgi:membrane protein YdbS with pleckstrin-like domain